MKSTLDFLRKAWYQSKIVLHYTCNAVWKWCKYEFTGVKGKRKWEITRKVLSIIGLVLWVATKVIGYACLIFILVFKLLLSIGDKD